MLVLLQSAVATQLFHIYIRRTNRFCSMKGLPLWPALGLKLNKPYLNIILLISMVAKLNVFFVKIYAMLVIYLLLEFGMFYSKHVISDGQLAPCLIVEQEFIMTYEIKGWSSLLRMLAINSAWRSKIKRKRLMNTRQ